MPLFQPNAAGAPVRSCPNFCWDGVLLSSFETTPGPGSDESGSTAETEISLTFRKGLQVMMAFDGDDRQLTLAEIARKTGLNRSVARRLVRTLLHMGILRETGQRFEMTVGVLRLARGFTDGHRIAQIIQPILRRTSESISENVSFALRDGVDATYVAHAQVKGSFTLNRVAIGTHVPLASTAAGHAILAHVGPDDWPDGVDRTPALDETIQQVHRRGFAYLADGLIDGVSSVAFPVFRANGLIEGAVSILFPTDRFDPAAMPASLIAELRQCAVDIGTSL